MASTILVTGAAGLLGGEVVRQSLAVGARVTALDRIAGPNLGGVRTVVDDLSDVGRLRDLLDGVDTVVHCAAYPNPTAATEETVFGGNVTSTANLLFAAEARGVRRFVYASSQSALGLAYAPKLVPPDYLPVDEDHPCRPGEGYGLSKLVGEQLCALVAGRSGMVTRALRFPVIWSPARFDEHVAKRLGDPVQAAKSQWAYVDVRDAGRACLLACADHHSQAHAIVNVAAAWPFACDPAEDILQRMYGGVERRPGWWPGDPVLSVEGAEAVLGFRARWRWTPDGIIDGSVS
jgi:UDP-glucose 4-epimerase